MSLIVSNSQRERLLPIQEPFFFNRNQPFVVTEPKEFIQPDGSIKKFGNKLWFTNLDPKKRHERLVLCKEYSESEYPVCDNYVAINVNRVDSIPVDYDGAMGVPITFLDKHNPEQFEVVGLAAGNSRATGLYYDVPYTPHKEDRGGCFVVKGKRQYARILIRWKGEQGSSC